MFGRKKEAAPPPPRKGGGAKLMAQMGLGPVPTDKESIEAMMFDDDDDDLEAELAALAGEDPAPRQPKKPQEKAGPLSLAALDKMVANSMKDVTESEEDASDIDDPELLAELQILTAETDREAHQAPPPQVQAPPTVSDSGGAALVQLLEDRMALYEIAVSNAKAAGDSSKARRLDRGLKTLRDLMRQAKAGRPVPEDDIPPPVSTSARPTPVSSPMKEQVVLPAVTSGGSPSRLSPAHQPAPQGVAPKPATTPGSPSHSSSSSGQPASPVHALSDSGDDRGLLTTRRDQYRSAALSAKHSGDDATARKYIRTAKQFDTVIQALDEGKPIDLSQMPPPPPGFSNTSPSREVSRPQGSSAPTHSELASAAAAAVAARAGEAPEQQSQQQEESMEEVPDMSLEDKMRLFKAPAEAGSVLEALEQRREKYHSSCLQAKGENNNSKARRMGRIVKQYEDAIKQHKAGHPVDYSELPTPPGFPPIPAGSTVKQPPPTPSPLISPSPSRTDITPAARPARSPQGIRPPPTAAAPAPTAPPAARHPAPASTNTGAADRPPPVKRQMSLLSRTEQQAMFLQERQLAFKREALKAKQQGDIELAKKFLRQAMGFDQMIEAAKSGLPVDMSQIPALPGSDNDKLEFVSGPDAGAPSGDRNEMYKTLEQELIAQIRTCTTNSGHFTKLGDVSSASKFDKIGANARKDLDSLKNAYKHGDPVPRFHYETRTYTLVKSCPELGDNDLELTVVRGINYPLPSDYAPGDLDTYIKYEFPYPTEDPQKGYMDTVKGTNNPENNQVVRLNINRKSRSFLRLLKNKGIKLELYYKRGFFKGDKVLGTASVKLLPLENVCVIHDSFDLMDGRKAVGGKIEVKIRIREPFVGKQVEEVKEKWLIIDRFERTLPAQSANPLPTSSNKGAAPAPPANVASTRVLEYEKQLLDRQIQQMSGRLSRSQEDAMKKKSQQLAQQVEEQREALRRGGVNAMRAYADSIERLKAVYLQEAGMLVKAGNREKAQILVAKKKIIEKEVEVIRSKLPRT